MARPRKRKANSAQSPATPAAIPAKISSLIARSTVPSLTDYTEYRPYLRVDFLWSCAYCTITEAEATGFRMTIDHYEPQSARPDLDCDYSNLMYCCDECNARKGDRYPPISARENGFRFFRVDQDEFSSHFELIGLKIGHTTNVGYYTIQALDLNRQALQRIRSLRMRAFDCHELALEGIRAIKSIRLDLFSPTFRGRVLQKIREWEGVQDQIESDIDSLLERLAKSPLLDADPEIQERAEERKKSLDSIEALHPGNWRGRQTKAAAK